MKKLMVLILSSLTLLIACSKDDDGTDESISKLVTPQIRARVTDPLNQNPFTGILEVYPCKDGTSIITVIILMENLPCLMDIIPY